MAPLPELIAILHFKPPPFKNIVEMLQIFMWNVKLLMHYPHITIFLGIFFKGIRYQIGLTRHLTLENTETFFEGDAHGCFVKSKYF
jgi:hypothetical protein